MSNPVELSPKEYVEVLTLLKKIDFLHDAPEDQLKSLLFLIQKESASKLKTILFQGEISNQLFIISKGKVLISTKNKGQKILLAELSTPSYFGEISLLTPTSATATVTAGEDGAELLILSHDALAQISKKIPDIRARIQKVIDARIDSKKKAKEAEESS